MYFGKFSEKVALFIMNNDINVAFKNTYTLDKHRKAMKLKYI